MFKNSRIQTLLVLAVGMSLGYGAANGHLRFNWPADAAPAGSQAASSRPVDSAPAEHPGCCMEGNPTGIMLAQAGKAADQKAPAGKRPNILFIMGDDIGWMQPSCYHHSLMVGETPNIDCCGRCT